MAFERFEVPVVDLAVQQAVRAWSPEDSLRLEHFPNFPDHRICFFLMEHFLNSNVWLINQMCMVICDIALLLGLKKTGQKGLGQINYWKKSNFDLYVLQYFITQRNKQIRQNGNGFGIYPCGGGCGVRGS